MSHNIANIWHQHIEKAVLIRVPEYVMFVFRYASESFIEKLPQKITVNNNVFTNCWLKIVIDQRNSLDKILK